MARQFLRLLIVASVATAAWSAAAVAALAGGGCHGATGTDAVEASSTVVKIDGCTFAPAVDRVPAGTVVTFLNSGTGPHDVTGTMQEWGSPTLEPGQSWTMGFQEAGVYPYSCSLHPGMAGVLVVGGSAAADDSSAALAGSVGPGSRPADGGTTGVAVVAGTVGVAFGLFGIAALAARRRTVEV